MKKVLFIACLMLMSVGAFAQKGNMTLGLQGNYMIDSPNNFGIGAGVGYELIDNLRGVAEFNYLLKKDYVSFWNGEVNVEYLFKVGDGFTIYPLAGLDILGWSVENGGSDSKLGLNLGVGAEYAISEKLSLKAEYNYKTNYDGWSLLKLGVVIPF